MGHRTRLRRVVEVLKRGILFRSRVLRHHQLVGDVDRDDLVVSEDQLLGSLEIAAVPPLEWPLAVDYLLVDFRRCH